MERESCVSFLLCRGQRCRVLRKLRNRVVVGLAPRRSDRARGDLDNDALDKVLWEDALLLGAGFFVDIFAVVPVVVLDAGNGDDLVGREAEVVFVRGRVVIEGLDLERRVRRGHGDSVPGEVVVVGGWRGRGRTGMRR